MRTIGTDKQIEIDFSCEAANQTAGHKQRPHAVESPPPPPVDATKGTGRPSVSAASRPVSRRVKASPRSKTTTGASSLSFRGIPEPKYQLLNVSEVAAYLHVSVATIWRWSREREEFRCRTAMVPVQLDGIERKSIASWASKVAELAVGARQPSDTMASAEAVFRSHLR